MSAPRTNGQGVSESGASHGGDISKQRSWAQTLVVLLAIAAAGESRSTHFGHPKSFPRTHLPPSSLPSVL
jgi:hypothetical protein